MPGVRNVPVGPGAVLVEALRYRSLRYVSQALGSFQVLVGPNASGKSNFLDVPAFLGDALRSDLETAFAGDERVDIPLRSTHPRNLTWMGRKDRFELAVEMAIPSHLQGPGPENGDRAMCRYEVAVDVSHNPRFLSETLWHKPATRERKVQRQLFPLPPEPPPHIVLKPGQKSPSGWLRVVSRGEEPERVTYRGENGGWRNHFRITTAQSALANLPADEERFPVALWFRRSLRNVQRITLSSAAMRRPCPPVRGPDYLPDGSNLPHVVRELEMAHPDSHRRWLEHVREALPDIDGITTKERSEDRHRYLVVRYKSGLLAPAWMVSDGTLRLLALTLLAYLPELKGTYLIEEPENGIHPRAVENIFQSISSVYGAQVLLTTHSPLVARLTSPDQLLCVARSETAGTDIISGDDHPILREWQGRTDLGTLLASGVLE